MLVCILNKETGTEWLIGNLFSVWVKISTNHPVILVLPFSLCISVIKLQKKRRKKLGFDDTDLFPLVGGRRGRWRALAHCLGRDCLHILRSEGMFIPKQSSALEFHGFPSPPAFNFCCVLSPASSLCQERAGRRARLGTCGNIPSGNMTWNNLHENVARLSSTSEPRCAPKTARVHQAPSPAAWGGSAAQAPPALPTPWPQRDAQWHPQPRWGCSVEVWVHGLGAELCYPARLGMEGGLSWNLAT